MYTLVHKSKVCRSVRKCKDRLVMNEYQKVHKSKVCHSVRKCKDRLVMNMSIKRSLLLRTDLYFSWWLSFRWRDYLCTLYTSIIRTSECERCNCKEHLVVNSASARKRTFRYVLFWPQHEGKGVYLHDRSSRLFDTILQRREC